MKLKRRIRETIAYVLIFAIIIGIMRQEGYAKAETQNNTTNAEYYSEECLIEYRTMSSWGNYANVNVSITNEGERKVSLWELEFSYSSKIENIWNADVLSEGDGDLKIGAKTYNSVIEKGQTVSFGFTARRESGQPEAPGQMKLTDEQSRKKAVQPEETPDGTETGAGQSVNAISGKMERAELCTVYIGGERSFPVYLPYECDRRRTYEWFFLLSGNNIECAGPS